MAKIWRNRIWAGTQRFEFCPSRYKTQVIDLMREDLEDGLHTVGDLEKLVEDGMMSEEEMQEIIRE